MFDMSVSLMSEIALDLSHMLRVAGASRHGANVPFFRRARGNAWEVCPDRV
jgi:hypothetical protein